MKIKVCGMRNPQNISELGALPIDIIGLIFYEKSPRFVGDQFDKTILQSIPASIEKAGVFVNATEDYICKKVIEYNLDYIQFHGNETPEFCRKIKTKLQVKIIKAFQVDKGFSDKQLEGYDEVDYFLFDTKSNNYGGTGQKFEWEILRELQLQKPYFLSGGITENDVAEIKIFSNSLLYAIDINSKFEIEPGLKDCKRIEGFVKQFK